jgi:hypothetical protein
VSSLGLKEIKRKVIESLQRGLVQHETTRSGRINEKNLLLVGLVTTEEVIELINGAKGSEYLISKHHFDRTIEVHIFKLKRKGQSWYIKCYFLEPDLWFISVHH